MSIRLPGSMLMVLVLASVSRGQLVDNLQYQSWRYCKPGTKVIMRQETSAQGKSVVQELTRTLLEITPEKIVLDLSVMNEIQGIKRENKGREDIPARIYASQQRLPAGLQGTTRELDKQMIEIGGKKIECKVFEFTGEGSQGKATGVTWQTLEIPGGVAKTEMVVQARFAATIKTTVTSIQVKEE